MFEYRSRLYANYVEAGKQSLAPKSIQGFASRSAYLKELIRNHFPPDKSASIFEVGCGHGTLIYFARLAGYEKIRGVDLSPQQVAAASQLGIEGVELGDTLQSLREIPTSSLDCVIAFDVIEHYTRNEILPILDEVHRVLRDGGRWIIHCPNAESPFFGRVYFGDCTHEFAYTCRSLTQMMRSSGFDSISCFEDSPQPRGIKGILRALVWRLVRLNWSLMLLAESGTGVGIFSQNLLAVVVK
jgi:SAM-dependent methyltransferase